MARQQDTAPDDEQPAAAEAPQGVMVEFRAPLKGTKHAREVMGADGKLCLVESDGVTNGRQAVDAAWWAEHGDGLKGEGLREVKAEG